MELLPSADQLELQAAVRDLCRRGFDSTAVRALEATGGLTPQSWAALADIGIFALRVPEAAGGLGLGMPEAALVFEELGRAAVPGPVIASQLAAPLVEGAAQGQAVVGLVERGEGPVLVEHLDHLDVLVVLDDDGVHAVRPAELDAAPVPHPLDTWTPLHRVAALPRGAQLADAAAAARCRLEGAVLTAALQVGSAQATLDLSVRYALARQQFGRVIGQFQAVKHLLADMLVRLELARSAVWSAAVILDDPEVGEPRRAAATAKIVADEAAAGNARSAVQVHGGMGFTWDVDVQLHLKRAWVRETHFGSASEHAEMLADLL